MKIKFIGIGVPQNKDFISDRPHGSGDYDLLFVRTPAFFVINGERVRTEPDTLILYAPEDPQYYGAVADGYRDDFIHFVFEEDYFLLKKSKIPTNTLIKVKNPHALSNLWQQLQNERLGNGANSESIIDLLMQALFLKVSENLRYSDKFDDYYYPQFVELRALAYSCPKSIVSIPEYSRRMNISASYFHLKYKAIFGVTPAEDFIDAKIGMACHLLKNTDKTVRQISIESGYTCEPHFMRQFKIKLGITPLEYRQKNTRR